MSTNKEIAQKLDEVYLDLGEYTTENGHQEAYKLHNFGSFLAYEQSNVGNQPLTSKIWRQQYPDLRRLKPKELEQHYNLDLSIDKAFLQVPGRGNEIFNQKAMFVGLNVAYRKNQDTSHTQGYWENFHDMKRSKNTILLYVETHIDASFEGCYITDVIKQWTDSNAKNVQNSFLSTARDDVATKHFQKCAYIFEKECEIIKPKRLVIFGKTAEAILEKMGRRLEGTQTGKLIEHRVLAKHYSWALSVERAERAGEDILKNIKYY